MGLSRSGKSLWIIGGLGALFCVVFFLMVYRLESAPPLWWDEGWTLNVARNWVELGHYGQLLNGEPRSTGLSAAFPVVAPVALSFKLFGVGIWQGRLPGLLFTFGALALIYYLAKHLFNQEVAVGTLGILLLTPISRDLHPILVGRQVLGEIPSLFYLLAGYFFLLLAHRGSKWWIFPAMFFWGVAIKTKAQVLPFWLASILVTFVIASIRRWWKSSILLAVGGIGAWMAAAFNSRLIHIMIGNRTLPGTPIDGLYSLTAIVPDWYARQNALIITLTFGLPALMGIMYGVYKLLQQLRDPSDDVDKVVLRIALLVLAGSWFGWYTFLGMYWIRYVFPAVYIGSIFAGALLYEISGHYSLPKTIERASSVILQRQLNLRTLGALFVVLWLPVAVIYTGLTLYYSYTTWITAAQQDITHYINTQIDPDALIETYDSEVFFQLDCDYHYPPDYISVELARRSEFELDIPIDYDPLAADPDYLVVGVFSRLWHLYDDVLATDEFHLLHDFSHYQIYERVRH